MSYLLRTLILVGVLASHVVAASITYEVVPLPAQVPTGAQGGQAEPRAFEYRYRLFGISLLAGQELDIKFDPALYGPLWNPSAPLGLDVLVLQPDNPPGSGLPGDLSVLALADLPTIDLLSVDFIFLGAGMPGPQTFFINSYDSNGAFLGEILSGTTAPASGAAVPEPAALLLVGLGLLLLGARAVKR
ncbi:MAG: PEP-CTERM sorting domain-containing protein [Bryobacteraceae bacterium]|nr:PEP-CTERM sorting domain-containing protein [Bryobacteraceae bacterium]